MINPRLELDEKFRGNELDLDVWFPYYLPHWSSRSRSAANYAVQDGELHLTIPSDQPLWCDGLHEEPLRVSVVQTGSFAGPLGCMIGQQPFRAGLQVQEEQPTFWGYTPHCGQVEVRMKARVTPRSMFAFYMSGIEDRPERSGETCVVEVFGETILDGSSEVGIGVKRLGDPALSQEFSARRIDIDVSEFHTYGVEWRRRHLDFTIDGEVVRRVLQSPDYPMQLMLGVFDFPAKAGATVDETAIPELVIAHVRGTRPPLNAVDRKVRRAVRPPGGIR